MAYYPAKDLTGKTPAATYTNLLEKEGTTTIVDGSGNTFLELSSYATTTAVSSSTVSSASFSITASHVLGGVGSSLGTGSTYPITASRAITSSFATRADTLDGLDSTAFQLALGTGSTYPITASRVVEPVGSSSYSTTSSYALNAGGSGASLGTGSTYPFTSSWSITSSYALAGLGSGTTLNTGSSYPITSSWALNALNFSGSITSASYAGTASLLLGSVVSALSSTSSSYASASNTSSYSLRAETLDGLDSTAFQLSLSTGSTYPFTSSWSVRSVTASFASGYQLSLGTGSSYPITSSWSISSSWAPSTATSLGTGSTYPFTSSWSINSSTASFVSGYQLSLGTGSTYPFTSSWANLVVSSSYAGTASVLLGTIQSSSYCPTASYSITSSWAIDSLTALSSDFAALAGVALTASYTSVSVGTSSYSYTSSYNVSSSYSLTSSYSLNGGGSGTSLGTGSTYPFTSSWAVSSSNAITSSYALNYFSASSLNTINFIPDGVNTKAIIGFFTTSSNDLVVLHQSTSLGGISINTSGSNRVYITTTGEIQLSGSVKVTGSLLATSSYSITASYALNGGGSGTSLGTGSTYPFTSSWATTAVNLIGSVSSASYSATSSLLLGSVQTASFAYGTPTVTVTAPPFNANNIGGADATLAIQLAVNSISASGGVIFCPAGIYNISGSIDLSDKVVLQGESTKGSSWNGTLFYRATDRNSPYLNIQGNLNNSVRGIIFRSAAGSTGSVGIQILSSSYVDVDTCTFLYCKHGIDHRNSWIDTIENCSFLYCTASIFLDNQSNQITIVQSHFTGNDTAISASTVGGACYTIDVKDNDIEYNVNGIRSGDNISGLSIQNNHIENNTNSDIIISGSRKTTIERNVFVGGLCPRNIQLSGSNAATIANNVFFEPSTTTTHSVLYGNLHLQRYGNYYHSTGPRVVEVGTSYGFVNENGTSSFAYSVLATSSYAQYARPQQLVYSSSDAATIQTNASVGDYFRVVLGGNRTLANPTGSIDGTKITWELIQDAGGNRTITLGNKFITGSDFNVSTNMTSSKRDFLTAVYNAVEDKWFVLGFVKGY